MTSSEIETMLVEILTGKPSSLHTAEAMLMRSQLQSEVDEIQAKGGEVEIPSEIPELD